MSFRDRVFALKGASPLQRETMRGRLGLSPVAVAGQGTPRSKFRRPVVQPSADLDRICALPVREVDISKPPEFPFLERLKKPAGDCKCAAMGRPCAREALPLQAWSLLEAYLYQRLAGAIGVGHGKELLCLLLPLVLQGIETAILLIPSDMREAFAYDWEYYSQHWILPNLVGAGGNWNPGVPRLKVLTYGEIQQPRRPVELKRWKPDVVIANEAHNLAGVTGVRWTRLLECMQEFLGCKFIPVTGTMMKDGVEDYAHLLGLSHGEQSPVPLDPDTVEEWGLALDLPKPGGKVPALMGALSKLCRPGETVHQAFRRRVWAQTPGILATSEGSLATPLVIDERVPPAIPENLAQALKETRSTGHRPDEVELIEGDLLEDGEEFDAEAAKQRCLLELSSGFFYRWIFPRGEAPEVIEHWRSVRRAMNSEIAEVLQNPRPYFDSPKLVVDAAERALAGLEGTPEAPVWRSRFWELWKRTRDTVEHETEAVWLSDFLARDAVEWARTKPGIVWYSTTAFGDKLQELSGLRRYDDASQVGALLRETGKESILCSFKSCGTGKNLQAFHRNLFAEVPPDKGLCEQHLGRTHRRGQQAPEVLFWLYRHTPEVRAQYARAYRLACRVEADTLNKQRLCYAAWSCPRPTETEIG